MAHIHIRIAIATLLGNSRGAFILITTRQENNVEWILLGRGSFLVKAACLMNLKCRNLSGPVPSIPVFEPAQDIHEPRQKLGKPSLVAVGKATLNGKGTGADASRNNKLRVPPTAEEGAPFEEKPGKIPFQQMFNSHPAK